MRRGSDRGSACLRQDLRRGLRLAACLCCLSAATAGAQGVAAADIAAAARALQFLQTLPRSGNVAVGVVAGADRAAADDTAQQFRALPAPNSASFETTVLSPAELSRFAGRLDVLFLMPGTSANAEPIVNAVRSRHLVSISDDPQCLDARCCVLMVRSGQRVEIVLDTTLAEAAGAQFSTVFTMMVKRK
jgi:hypothetical protein